MQKISSNTTRLLAALIILSLGVLPAFASTIAIMSGSCTVDGRPMLMKNRDNSANPDQEFRYDNSGIYNFIGVGYAGVTDQAWGGVNETGFAVHNANAWNFPDNVPGVDDDGYIMQLALSTCRTVDDFAAIMDSTDGTGRTVPAIYGVLDAFGGGALFEAGSTFHYRFDLSDTSAAPHGYMVRANFAYNGGSYHLGQHRHDRVLFLLDSAYTAGIIKHDYLTQHIQNEIINEQTNPYPLPFDGREGLMPYGLIHTHDAINRDISRSALVIQGINPGEDPLLCTIWAMVGEPICTSALPLWVKAGSTPVEFDGPVNSALNMKAQAFHAYLYQTTVASDAMDTWLLEDERGVGLLPYLNNIAVRATIQGDSALNRWRTMGIPSPAQVATFQNQIAATALADMEAWGPPAEPQVSLTRLNPTQVRLTWAPVDTNVFGDPVTVTGYTIFASSQPFYNRFMGDSLTTVASSPIVISAPESYRFFQVRCRH
ncbi:MAG: hypothetical protein NTW14_13410 [bacterium]|nr:hypothetical protein [bacterium]